MMNKARHLLVRLGDLRFWWNARRKRIQIERAYEAQLQAVAMECFRTGKVVTWDSESEVFVIHEDELDTKEST